VDEEWEVLIAKASARKISRKKLAKRLN